MTLILQSIDQSKSAIQERCSQIFFRQSMINDIMLCPKMAMYRWVMNLEETSPYMAAVLGTAGHEVIFKMHLHKKFDFSTLGMLTLLEKCFNEAISNLSSLPIISKNSASIREEFLTKADDYVEMLVNYQRHPQTRSFRSTMHEQAFVLEVIDPLFPLEKGLGTKPEKPFLFTGQIDQFGLYDDGVRALRDIKFRDNAFKPDFKAFNFNPQMTIYAAALKYGNPACAECKPRYEENEIMGTFELVYDGPCEKCKAKIGTPLWPGLLPERCELVWMRDFQKYKRAYGSKKKGDMKGTGYIYTYRPPTHLHVLMHDVIGICREVRNGNFYRKPGSHCSMWCKYYEQCRQGVECDIDLLTSTLKDATLIKQGIYSDDDMF